MRIFPSIFVSGIVMGFTLTGVPSAVAADASKPPPAITTSDRGLSIAPPGMGTFTLRFPTFAGGKISSVDAKGQTATVTYDNGTKLGVQIDDKNVVTYHFTGLPDGLKKVESEMVLPDKLVSGGSFRLNDGAAISFTETLPDDTFLYADNQAFRLAVHNSAKNSFVLNLPEHSYVEVKDRRDDANVDFVVRIASPAAPDLTLRLGDPAPAQPAADPDLLTVPHLLQPMEIDGKADKWADVPVNQIPSSRLVDGDFKTAKPGEPTDPVSATFQTGWDAECLYLFVAVTDPSPMHNANPSLNKLGMGDGVEVFIGGDQVDMGGDLQPTDLQIILGADEIAGSLISVSGQTDPMPFKSVVMPSKGGYTIEAAIPFKLLGFKPEAGRQFRLDIGINDSADGKDRRCQLMWSGTNLNALTRSDWGRAVLGK